MILENKLPDAQLAKIAELVAILNRVASPSTSSKGEEAKVLGVSLKTVSRRIDAGLIPKVPKIEAIRIPAAFIDSLVNSTPTA